jgi:hypothetical protein
MENKTVRILNTLDFIDVVKIKYIPVWLFSITVYSNRNVDFNFVNYTVFGLNYLTLKEI